MIGRFRRWWNRWFGTEYELFDTTDIHEMLVNKLHEWDESFHPDNWD